MKTFYMILDFDSHLCYDGWLLKEMAQKEIDSWEDKDNYNLLIVPTVDAESEDDAQALIYTYGGRDNHFTTMAKLIDVDEDELLDGTIEPIRVWNM